MLKRHAILLTLSFSAFALGLNIHLPDFGETYVSRNLFPWAFMALAMVALWWRPLIKGPVKWQSDWLIGFLLPVIGAILVLFVQIIGGFTDYHLGHYFLPAMFLVFGLFVLGLLQHDFKPSHISLALGAGLVALLPQYLLHLITTNPIVFFPVTLEVPRLLFKEFMGFGQYNLYGSFLASCLLLTFWASSHLAIKRWQQIGLLVLLFVYALDVPLLDSKTALLGLGLGVVFFAVHLYQHRRDKALIRRAILAMTVFVSALLVAIIANYLNTNVSSRVADWTTESSSFKTRYSMWVIAWNGFLESPLFGHGLGSYSSVYTDHFGRYGLEQGLTFVATVSLPHNLILHLLCEIGLLGTLAVLGPYVWLALHIVRHQPNRFLLIAMAMPVLIHTQLEYPYIASSSHYLIFAVGLFAAMQGAMVLNRRFEFSEPRNAPRFVSIGLVSLTAVLVLACTAHMQHAVYQSVMSISRTASLPLSEYLEQRYQGAELRHPVIRQRMLAISDLTLARKALSEKEYGLLNSRVIPSLVNNVFPHYNNDAVWKIMFWSYLETGNIEASKAMAEWVGRFDPNRAIYYRKIIQVTLREKTPEASPLPR